MADPAIVNVRYLVNDVAASTKFSRLTGEGVKFRNDIVTGPGGAQALAIDPSGNLVEIFQPAMTT